jgi:hypothetical protein
LREEQKAQIKSEILTSTFGEDVVKVAISTSSFVLFVGKNVEILPFGRRWGWEWVYLVVFD